MVRNRKERYTFRLSYARSSSCGDVVMDSAFRKIRRQRDRGHTGSLHLPVLR